jgi:hypothetical protein
MRLLPPPDTRARDLLVAGVALGGGLLLYALGTYPIATDYPAQPPDWLYLVPMVIGGASLMLRRRAPLVCLGVGAAAFAADLALGGSVATGWCWCSAPPATSRSSARRPTVNRRSSSAGHCAPTWS